MHNALLRLPVALVLVMSIASPAIAMSEKEASRNLMYFAFAMKEGERCEKMGFPGMSALRSWEQKNGAVLIKSLRRIEEYAVASQKMTKEQATDVSLGLFVRHKESFDREIAPKHSQKSCMRFGETLRLYEEKLVRE